MGDMLKEVLPLLTLFTHYNHPSVVLGYRLNRKAALRSPTLDVLNILS
jgi:hypothetical protein